MNLLLDTHLILWAASLWEIAIKRSLGWPDFLVDPRRLWRLLPLNGYRELPVTGEHGIAVENLP